jgi:hypothetical protein
MSIQEFLDSCNDTVDIDNSFTLSWSKEGVGFGEFRFYKSEDEAIHINNECMGKNFIKNVLCNMVDIAILDDPYEKIE